MDGPLALFYSLESVLLALAVSGLTQVAKGALPRGERTDKVLLPLVPILLGALLAVLVPFRPATLADYAGSSPRGWMVYALWGMTVGQFADYLYQRARRFINPSARPSVPPAEPTLIDAPSPEAPAAEPAAGAPKDEPGNTEAR